MEYEQKILELSLLNSEFQEDIHIFRERHRIPPEGFHSEKEFRDWYEVYISDDDQFRKYLNDEDAILENFPQNWHMATKHYIRFNKPGNVSKVILNEINPFLLERFKGDRPLCFVFQEGTTEEDIDEALKYYRSIKKLRKPRKAVMNNFKLYKRILELSYELKSDKSILTVIKKEFRGRSQWTTNDISKYRYKAKSFMITYKRSL